MADGCAYERIRCAVDTDLIDGALYIDGISTQKLTDEAVRINQSWQSNSAAQLGTRLNDHSRNLRKIGCIPGSQKATVTEAQGSRMSFQKRCAQMLRIQQQLGKTSIKKYVAMDTAKGEGDRVRVLHSITGYKPGQDGWAETGSDAEPAKKKTISRPWIVEKGC